MPDDIVALPVTRLSRLSFPDGRDDWLIEGLWAHEAVGVIGGIPKACKTWLALEMALAVASGQPCLGRFPVKNPGHVLLFCAEDGPRAVQQRVAGLAKARGIDFERLAIGWIDAAAIWLDDDIHQKQLAQTVAKMKPRLLVLDPLVRLHRGDENSSGDIAAVLGYLRALQREHHVAIILVHHVRKSGASQPGQALRGSGDLHAWGDSNCYLLSKDGDPTLVAEHRAHPAPDPVVVRLQGDPPRLVPDGVRPTVTVAPIDQRIVQALAVHPLTRTALRELIGVRNETLGIAIDRLVSAGRVVRIQDGLTVPVPASADRRERNEP
jgi:AAA domain